MRSSPHTAAVINQQFDIACTLYFFFMPFAQVAETLYLTACRVVSIAKVNLFLWQVMFQSAI